MIRAAARLLIALTLPLPSMAGPVTDWLGQAGGELRQVVELGSFTPDGPDLIAADPLTFDNPADAPFFQVPPIPAKFTTLLTLHEGEVAMAALIFRDVPPVCGRQVASLPAKGSTGAFLTRKAAESLDALRDDYTARGQNLYDGYFAQPGRMDADIFSRMLSLPDGTSFPAFSTGLGKGNYPVIQLADGGNRPIAIYVDMKGGALPPPCPG